MAVDLPGKMVRCIFTTAAARGAINLPKSTFCQQLIAARGQKIR
jgi:hypothetical protein